MSSIVILDEITINKIAAGEVVNRPESIVKELVENSIDAGATHISVEIKNGGISYIKITDNGKGISQDDVEIAFERHATSKIRKETDILRISSMGFRGEALASIASIAKVTLETKVKNEATGTRFIIEGGNKVSIEEIAWTVGTTITVENVFYNVPARYKFLKKDYTEAGYIEDVVRRLALSNPHISFKYVNNNKQIIQTTGNMDLKTTIYNLFGKKIADNIINVNYTYENFNISGVIGTPKIARATRQNEFTYINKRYVKDKTITTALEKAFEQNLNIGKFPFAAINLTLPPNEVDVNVHPAKLEVKFENEQKVFETIYHGVMNAVLNYHKSNSPFAIKELVQGTEKPEEAVLQESFEKDKSITDTMERIVESLTNNKKEEIKNFNSPFEGTYYKPKENEIEIQDVLNIAEETKKDIYNTKASYKYIGSLFNTYILLEISEKLYIIDQHAAHERLLYERIKDNYYNKQKQTQMLLIPELLELKNKEIELVNANKEMFEQAGFILEDFGDNAIKLSGIPNIGYDIEYREMFTDILDKLQGGTKTTKEEREFRFLATIACKAAVKANMSLKQEEHVALIEEMIKLERPFTCPHGRPTAYEISKYEIERRFSRK